MATRTLGTLPHPTLHRHRRAGLAWRLAILLALLAGLAAWLLARPAIPQDPRYLEFVDRRALLGLPRALDVLSNLPFAAVGLWGLWLLRPGAGARLGDPRERRPWQACFAGVALTGLGSAWFHLDPTMGRLIWDRLPMTVGFMGLLAALVAERIDARAGARLLLPLLLAGAASVGWWAWGEAAGHGDLRPYFLVQFYPLAAVPLALLLFPRPVAGGAPRTGGWLLALALYGAAKLAEAEDGPVLALGGLLSGHTAKHLLAAAGIAALAWRLRPARQPAAPRGT